MANDQGFHNGSLRQIDCAKQLITIYFLQDACTNNKWKAKNSSKRVETANF